MRMPRLAMPVAASFRRVNRRPALRPAPRTTAIARGQVKPKPWEPKVWFTSTESFAKMLSNKNRALLEVITKNRPSSLQELAKYTGRKPSNLSRTLKTMEHYGFVRLHRSERGRVRPEVPYRSISLDLPLTA